MKNIILTFNDLSAAQKIRTILASNGLMVAGTTTCISQVVQMANRLQGKGVIISQLRLSDGLSSNLADYLPPDYEILILTHHTLPPLHGTRMVTTLPLPVRQEDLINTVRLLISPQPTTFSKGPESQDDSKKKGKGEKRIRSEEEIKLIRDAKNLLIDRNNLTEDQAHRFLQKKSMDSGMLLTETAKTVLEKW